MAISDRLKPLANHAHEAFARALSDGETQLEAHRAAGYRGGKASASRLVGRAEIMERVLALSTPSTDRAVNTVASLLIELEGARIIALQADPPNCTTAIKATMLKAKLLGLGVSGKGHTFTPVRARTNMVGQLLPQLVAFLNNSSVQRN